MMKEKQALTTGDVARYCGVHFRTVTRWIQKGHLKAFHLPGRGDSRIFVQDFLEFLKANQIAVPPELADQGAASMKAVIVEDDSAMARSIRRTLTGMGLQCEVASDGLQAGALIQSVQPDLLTLDLKMPGLGGVGVLENVRKLPIGKTLGVLVISGMEDAALKRAIAAGADGALRKPFTKAQLEEKTNEVLAARRGGAHERARR